MKPKLQHNCKGATYQSFAVMFIANTDSSDCVMRGTKGGKFKKHHLGNFNPKKCFNPTD